MSSHPKIGRVCMMKNLISGLKYFAFRNPHSAINSRGFTLIEIIILIVLAGILIPLIVFPFATGMRGSGKPEMATRAMYLAQQRMEELMKYNYNDGALALTTGFDLFATGDPNYPGEYEIIYVRDNLNPSNWNRGYKRITVRVRDPENTAYDLYALVGRFP
jgi:type II secretory pathway pseudopilin PulG